ncbi:MAG: hypothetical protein NC393_00385 [Clostridium sp.]|nr:hypothetical protein [Clostridium sp.]MCM1170564.1 hypothetical protein [Clostridium sp.]MCM1208724.1 hypothetical protein [Ruminococcus sp.]
MNYKSVNEIESFSYKDCRIVEFNAEKDCIMLVLEALIVKKDNSQNTNYTDSYAGTTTVRFIKGKITDGVKDGYKYYDANDVLINEVPDRKLAEEELGELLKQCNGAYLYFIDKNDFNKADDMMSYSLGIEFEDESEETVSDSYYLNILFEKAVFEWDRYMNRVQNN